MSKRQKGRRHRSVNRTPRPVGRRAAAPAPARPPVPPPAPPAPAPVPPALGRHTARTYVHLAEAGPHTVQELCEAVGYTPRTVTRHLEDLAGHGLATRAPDGRWAAAHPGPLAPAPTR